MKIFFKILSLVSILMFFYFNIYVTFASNISDNKNIITENNVGIYEDIALTEYKARVIQKILVYTSNIDGMKYQKVKVEILQKGIYEHKEYEADYLLESIDGIKAKELSVGKSVYVTFNNNNALNGVLVKDIDRIPYLTLALIVFIAIIVIIGKKQGIKTIISLVITLLSIFYILVPLIMNGYNAIFISVISCIVISIVNLILISGFNIETLIAIIGTISGLIIAMLLAIGISTLGGITGISNEDAKMILDLTNGKSIDLYGLFFAGIIIGTIGATMDISLTISATMKELVKSSESIDIKELIKSGLNIGKDTMGTMSNTLILAYVGESIILIVLFILNQANLMSILNSDFIASEILRGLCGTISMILAIPITTYVYGLIYTFNQKRKSNI